MVLTGVLLSVEGVPQLSGRAVGVIAWLVIGSSAAGFALMYHALRRLTNVELSSMTNLVPLVTAALAVAVLGEALGANMIAGLLTATAGVFIVQWRSLPGGKPS